MRDHLLEHVSNFFFTQKGGLDIDLGELGLTVGPQILVPETLGDLVITIVACNHQQLLKELGRLRQCKEVTIVHTTGHQVIPGTFGCTFGEHGGLDVNEPTFIQKLSHVHGDLVAKHQIVLHVRPTQIQNTVCQACGL